MRFSWGIRCILTLQTLCDTTSGSLDSVLGSDGSDSSDDSDDEEDLKFVFWKPT